MSDRYEDNRGVIQDLFDGLPVAVTQITTQKDEIRGNHVHHRTKQWTMVLTGRLRMVTDFEETELGPGESHLAQPGVAHAWQAMEDTDCLVFTRGPRSAQNYEIDTWRLEEPLIA